MYLYWLMQWQIARCQVTELSSQIGNAHVLVPLMTALDSKLLEQAKKARLVLQYGVGLEAVDIPAVASLVL